MKLKKLFIGVITVCMLSFSQSAFAYDAYEPANDYWTNAPQITNNIASTGTGTSVIGDFHAGTNLDPDFYIIETDPGYNWQQITFIVADYQEYFFAVYKYDTFGSEPALDSGILKNNEFGNFGFDIDPAGGERYVIYVTGLHNNTYPSAHYILNPVQHYIP
ncbi:hypothetical protein PAT3040_00863 [Paenibacillus agaridevorans]|uniref:Secreted protein n=1 Tax=Paenibacillus agaridevorans TaxID=171404 RepID=A0A2R5EMY2_9BACL|nr:hypothetical protein [Paenibacillus agaridevorans]GBG06338.1 hypothetical protein PAT3040_00863 [Paenibacillus agaridevorans]